MIKNQIQNSSKHWFLAWGSKHMADNSYRWVIVAAGGTMGCVAMGSVFSLPVLLNPMAEATGWSRTGISSAMTIGFLAMAVTSMIWGALSDRFGVRPVILSGAILFQPVSGWPGMRHPCFSFN